MEKLVELYAPPQTADSVKANPGVLREAEFIFSGWGMPPVNEAFLAAAPNLKAIFYAAGSVRGFATEAMWNRGITLTSAYHANAIPVAEFCVAQIIFCLKRGWHHQRHIHEIRKFKQLPMVGAYGAKVGLITLGMIGQLTAERLKMLDVEILAYSRKADAKLASELNLTYASLDEIFSTCDVVSLHTPWLKQTEKMIQGRHFELMKENSSFLNTARGAVVDEPSMIQALQKRPDICAVLDVTYPEPPVPDSPLWTLPNVVLLPHIAGSAGQEVRRMGRYAIEEARRYLSGQPLLWPITRELAASLA